MNHPVRSPRAFTLIEMLTVVAIIAILIALLFPAIQSAIRNAERAKAQTTVNGIAIAFRAYYTEYGRWPQGASGTGQIVTTNLLAGGGYNPRGIIFFEYQTKDVSAGNLLNSWKTNYFCAFDTDYKNSIANPLPASAPNRGPDPIPAGVIVWTKDGTSTNKYINSWQ